MTAIARNDLDIYDENANAWWDESVRWLRTLNNMVPARMRYFDQHVPDWSGLRVLDVGCGGGFMSEELSQQGATVVGIDPAADAIAAAREHAGASNLEIDYRTGVAERLPFETDQFDCVICVDVLEHVEDLEASLDEITRVLKPGGVFLFDTINRNLLASFIVVTVAERLLRILPVGTHDPQKFIRPRELRAALDNHCFQEAEMVGLGPVGLNRRFDFVFNQLPLTLVQYMGCARLTRA